MEETEITPEFIEKMIEYKTICDKIQAHFDRKHRLRGDDEVPFNEQYNFYSMIIPNLKKKLGNSPSHTVLQKLIDKWASENGIKCRQYLDYKQIPTLRTPVDRKTVKADENINNLLTLLKYSGKNIHDSSTVIRGGAKAKTKTKAKTKAKTKTKAKAKVKTKAKTI